MKFLIAFGCLLLAAHAESFEVASVKRSQEQKGIDYRGRVLIGKDRVVGRNVTLQQLTASAYGVQLAQVTGKLKWLGSEEFDVDARADGAASVERIRSMLQGLLVERFLLDLGHESRELRIQALVVDKGGLNIRPSDDKPHHFRGTLQQFADLLAVQVTIPEGDDPARPAMASSVPVLVIDKTGLDGVYDIDTDLKPEIGTDRLTQWQRVLKEQLGLRLESEKAEIDVLVVRNAEKAPLGN